jgi:hypothetical protein
VFIRDINTKFYKKSAEWKQGPTDAHEETNRHVAIVKEKSE